MRIPSKHSVRLCFPDYTFPRSLCSQSHPHRPHRSPRPPLSSRRRPERQGGHPPEPCALQEPRSACGGGREREKEKAREREREREREKVREREKDREKEKRKLSKRR